MILELILAIAVAFRVTWLITNDSITAPFRELVLWPDKIYEMLSCHWCAGMYVAAIPAIYLAPTFASFFGMWMLFSAATGIIGDVVHRLGS